MGNGSVGGAMKTLTVGGDAAAAAAAEVVGGGKVGAGGGDGRNGVDQPARFVGHSQPVYGLSWSPDGRFLLSAGGDGEVRMWDMAQGRTGNAAGYVRYDGHW